MKRLIRFAVAACLLAGSAFADAESDAKDLFTRGREARSRGDCAVAAPLFRRAAEIYPKGLGSVRNLAECEQSLGHYASARRTWLDLSRALLVEHDAKYAGWDDEAKKAASDLQSKVAVLRIDVTVSSPDGEGPATESSPIQVTLNNEMLPLKLVGTELDRDPGKYRVRVEGDRVQEPVEKTVELVPGRSESLAIIVTLRPLPKPPPPPPATTKGSPALLATGVILASAGVLALGGSGIAFGARQAALSDLTRDCPSYAMTGTCSNVNVTSIVSRGQTASAAATGLFIGGLIGIGAGVTLIVVSQAVRVRASTAWIEVEGRF
jgi:hypothetical protein